VKEVVSVKGDAQISMLRGKRKHIYDFTAELAIIVWEDILEGTVTIDDITADLEVRYFGAVMGFLV